MFVLYSFSLFTIYLFMFTCDLLFSFVLLPRLFAAFAEFTITQSLLSDLAAPVLSYLLSMVSFSRKCMPAITSQQNRRQGIPNTASTSTTSIIGEVNGRVDQLALVQEALQNGATPTMIAGFAMIITQMQAQAAYPEVLLTITSSIGPLERSATFRDGLGKVRILLITSSIHAPT